MAKDKEERYRTAKDLLIDLQNVRQELDFQNKLERTAEPHSEAKTEILDVAEITDKRPSAEITTSRSKNRRLGFIISAIALLFAVVGFGYWFFNTKSIESIAVMPFVNESGNADVEYLSDGMTETLISSLSNIPNLNVKARSSVFRYKGKEDELQKIGKELNVEAILTGRIVQRGNELKLYITLIDAATEKVLWKSDYDRSMTNLVALQSDIARDVSGKLKIKLSGADEQKLAKNYTANAEAYQLYLKGRFHALKLTRPELQKGVSYFQQAIVVDPNYALAYVGLADAYRSLSLSAEIPPSEVFPNARAAAKKAIEIDDTLADAHSAFGNIIFRYDWDLNAAETQYKRALELDPNSADTHINYSGLLSSAGRHAEALAEAKLSRELDPLNLRTNTLEAQALLYAGQTDEALAQLQKTFELDPNFWLAHQFAASAYIDKGMYTEAIAEARKARDLADTSHPAAFLAYALAKSDKQAEAKTILEELLKLSTKRYVSAYAIALIYNGLEMRDKTLIWLERAFQERDARMVFLKVESKWNNLHDDPRFQELLKKVGLPQ